MIEELAGPGVEYSDHAEVGADEPRVLSQLLQSSGGSAKEQIVDQLLMAAGERAQLCGQGKGDKEVMSGQQQLLLLFEPIIGLLILALGTMPVLAGVITVALRLALTAEIELAAETLGAAGFNV